MKKLFAGLAGLIAAFGLANAAETDRAMGYEIANLERILAPDYASLERNTINGRTVLVIRTQTGAVAVLMPNMCDRAGANCKGLYMQSFFSEQPSMSSVNAHNQSAFIAAAVKDQDGRARLFRYLIADFGYVEGSLRADVLNFFAAGRRFHETVLSTGSGTANTISLDASADAAPAGHETPTSPLIAASADLLKSISFDSIDETLYSRPGGAAEKVEQ